MQPEDLESAKMLIFHLARSLKRAGREQEVLAAFLAAYPAGAEQYLAALHGNEIAAFASLNAAWPFGGSGLSEYALGDRASVLASLHVISHLIRPSKRRGRR